MKKIIIVLMFLLLSLPLFAETIILKSGKTIEAEIIERSGDYIKINVYGVPLTYYLEVIESIDGERVDEFSQPKDYSSTSTREESPAEIFKKVAPGVVIITVLREEGTGTDILLGAMGQGSGFIVKEEGVIVTNFHVVDCAQSIEVKLQNGTVYPVTGIIHFDPERDICILKIDADNLPTVSLGNSNLIKPGDKIFTIGAPMGLEYSISEGLMSGVRRRGGQKFLQLSAAISPGNSGGPLINAQGKVVGITSSGYSAASDAQNLNFAIPVNEVKKFITTNPKLTMVDFASRIAKARALWFLSVKDQVEGNINAAIYNLQHCINTDPTYIWAYIDLSGIYGETHMFDEAMAICKKAIAIAPDYPMLWSNLASAYGNKGMLMEAIEAAKKATSINPDNSFYHSVLSSVYSNAKMFTEAIAEGKKAVELDPYDSLAYTKLGIAYGLANMHQKAIAVLKKAVALDPQNGEAYFRLGAEYALLKDAATSAKYLQKAIELGYHVPAKMRQSLNQYLRERR